MSGSVRTTTSGLPWSFRAALSRPHDGDSFFMDVDLGFNVRVEAELRLDGVYAPEIHPMQPGGQQTLDFVNQWLAGVETRQAREWPFWVVVTATRTYEPGMDMSFTRYVATVYPFEASSVEEQSLNYAVNTFLSGHPEWPRGD